MAGPSSRLSIVRRRGAGYGERMATKRQQTMAKIARERAVREKRERKLEKKRAAKAAKAEAAASGPLLDADEPAGDDDPVAEEGVVPGL